MIYRRQRRRTERCYDVRFRTYIFCQSLDTLQLGLFAIAELLVLIR